MSRYCEGTNEVRIVVLGTAGEGKSSTANTIFGEKIFSEHTSRCAATKSIKCHRKLVKGTDLTIVDTPGFFNSELTDETVDREIKQGIIRCKPGPHAFLLILRVGVYTRQNADSVAEFKRFLGEDVLKYTILCFTHGDDLYDRETIEDFVGKNSELKRLVDECEGRCHVIDNKYWNGRRDKYRNNKVQVKKLLKTVKQMQRNNGGSYYTADSRQKLTHRSIGPWAQDHRRDLMRSRGDLDEELQLISTGGCSHMNRISVNSSMKVSRFSVSSPMHLNGISINGPISVNGFSVNSPMHLNGISINGPISVNGFSVNSPMHLNGISINGPISVNGFSVNNPMHVNGISIESPVNMNGVSIEDLNPLFQVWAPLH
ncbi:GTPase IMAP family member 9 [Labeo rohita]|uniref:GTPase IMAP family member 9 n=1 Tax=Labeo rohita TaxID=84645 RepID=A0ABQ8L020_LABRO|nr:GTPase IMAP family member 9 [Labeo rohita]